MIFLENTAPTLPKEGVFVLVGIALLVLLYIVLKTVKNKKKPDCFAPEKSDEDEGEILAAITAAVSVILEEEAAKEEKEPPRFRVVAFKRTNNRRIGE